MTKQLIAAAKQRINADTHKKVSLTKKVKFHLEPILRLIDVKSITDGGTNEEDIFEITFESNKPVTAGGADLNIAHFKALVEVSTSLSGIGFECTLHPADSPSEDFLLVVCPEGSYGGPDFG